VTPAIHALESAGVSFRTLQYVHDETTSSWGGEAAAALGLDPDQVFKTLLVTADDRFTVAIVPIERKLSPKALGVVLGAKRADLAAPQDAQRVTGYVVGGISPFGQRRRLATVVDDSCQLHDVMYVSGGRRGLEVGVAPGDLIRLLAATVAPISS
jgi:Cys-tRNA(Pro)/Cys-tRNA(Cys) deacylase